jgi:RNA ligase (TIGR02306 family)
MSEAHTIKVVPMVRKSHPNAEKLEIISIDESYQVVINRDDWIGVEKAAWIRPDNQVDVTRSEFSWLRKGDETWVKVRPAKLRGELSYGFLAPVPDSFAVGDDVTEFLNVKPYEPELEFATEESPCPPGFGSLSKYDIENVKGRKRAFNIFERVILQEKINGENCRVVYADDRLYVGSRNLWKSEDNENSQFWNAVKSIPGLIAFCKEFPRTVVYGEVYGKMKAFPYDANGVPKFRCFDILKEGGHFVDAELLHDGCKQWEIPTVPLIGEINFFLPEIETLAEQTSNLALHMKEGICIVPLKERIHPKYGRVKAKCVSLKYLQS